MTEQNAAKKSASIWKSLRLGLIVLVSLVVFAYGFQVTQVSFAEIYSETRQKSLTRVIRALVQPDVLKYEQVEKQIITPMYAPCPVGGYSAPEVDQEGAYLVVTPPCAEPRSDVQIEGYNFTPNTRGQLYFIPPSEVSLSLGTYEADAQGYFSVTAKVPPRPNEQVQYVRTTISQKVGSPTLSRTAIDTWQKIVETVFLALLATVFGIIFAVPISFFAARNLMKDITAPMSSLALSLIGWPVGIWLGVKVAGWVGERSTSLQNNMLFSLLGILIGAALIWLGVRWALPQEEERKPSLPVRIARILVLLVVSLLGILILFLVSSLGLASGASVAKSAGFVGMFGSFLNNLSHILKLLIAVITGMAGGALVSGLFSRPGKVMVRTLSPAARLWVNLVLGALAGAVIGGLIGAGLDWLYQLSNLTKSLYVPAGVGAALGILAAILTRKQDALPIGIAIYYITRTILNGLRAIEALIWVIVFVVWVGIGPFAGVLALALHTIAALAKLYSEQVESISPGPMEAVKATGATRLQVVVYSVIPQIIPLYISFTMYRWDINVRMSTIIGFAGGGGIGFLLLQNINLLNYRAASTQMVAIAIVVALMDYLSSYMRERVV
ncbi:MAG: ABC transporter permease subunit [Anaerolineales bacterium]|nr:ABC transporter permease subunit [Anaerolineales bacterium]